MDTPETTHPFADSRPCADRPLPPRTPPQPSTSPGAGRRTFLARVTAAGVTALLFAALAQPGGGGGTAQAATKGTVLEVQVLGQGVPVPNVPVRVRKDDGSATEMWTMQQILQSDSTNAQGLVRYKGLAPGRYVVIANCGSLPGDWIAGMFATRVELLASRDGHATLTMRRGARLKGTVTQGGKVPAKVSIRTESPDALSSGCPMSAPEGPRDDGSFVVAKMPIGALTWVKAQQVLGNGEIGVWKAFRPEKAETTAATFDFPVFEPARLGNIDIGVRLADGKPVDKGRIELVQADPALDWRYDVKVQTSATDTLAHLKMVPPGRYAVRASAEPGGGPWWNATPESITVEAGKTTRSLIPARQRPTQ